MIQLVSDLINSPRPPFCHGSYSIPQKVLASRCQAKNDRWQVTLSTKMANHRDADRKKSRNDRPNTIGSRFKAYLFQNIGTDLLLELELMGLTLAAGMNDATTYPDYHVFASNQTGNTALLAVGSLGIGGGIVDLGNIGFSLGLFVLGGYVFGQMGDHFGRKRRGWLLFTNISQTVLVYAAAALRKWVARSSGRPPAWGVISLLAFASGGRTYSKVLSWNTGQH